MTSALHNETIASNTVASNRVQLDIHINRQPAPDRRDTLHRKSKQDGASFAPDAWEIARELRLYRYGSYYS